VSKRSSEFLFNVIAPVYGLFYRRQKNRYAEVLKGMQIELNLKLYKTVLDVGCGTGALCSALYENGLAATGIDLAEKMLRTAKKNPENKGVRFVRGNATETLPFADKRFDVSIASYVAHGLSRQDRKKLYAEMSRVTKHKVILHDYNQRRKLLTTIIEWLERGDYFRFIQNAETEMKECCSQTGACFSSVRVVNVGANAAWYICTPQER